MPFLARDVKSLADEAGQRVKSESPEGKIQKEKMLRETSAQHFGYCS
jgi:hypothetical protein